MVREQPRQVQKLCEHAEQSADTCVASENTRIRLNTHELKYTHWECSAKAQRSKQREIDCINARKHQFTPIQDKAAKLTCWHKELAPMQAEALGSLAEASSVCMNVQRDASG